MALALALSFVVALAHPGGRPAAEESTPEAEPVLAS
jgi:hypothetical protein